MISNSPRVFFRSKLSVGVLVRVGSTMNLAESQAEMLVDTSQAEVFAVVEEDGVKEVPEVNGSLALLLPTSVLQHPQ